MPRELSPPPPLPSPPPDVAVAAVATAMQPFDGLPSAWATAAAAEDAFAPYAHSLPSSFQRAKPRIYRSVFTPDAARPRQTRCAIVGSSSGPDSGAAGDAAPLLSDRGGEAGPGAGGRSRLRAGPGPSKAAVVSLEELDDGTTFLLDFRPGSRARRPPKSATSRSGEAPGAVDRDWDPLLLSWEGMTDRQRRLELQAAAKSRAVRELAEREAVPVPRVAELEAGEPGAFARWFLSSRQRRQRVREAFLREELAFAARDPLVWRQLAAHGRSPPAEELVGAAPAPAWREFATWYALGRSAVAPTHAGDQLLLRARLEERADFLAHRLAVVAATETELDLRAREAAEDPLEAPALPEVFVFEDVAVARAAGERDDPTSWENTSPGNRQKELALALMDPRVQVAAMRSEIALPDLSSASLEDGDLFSLAGRFLPWWKARRNEHRQAFLAREAREAARDAAVVQLLWQAQQPREHVGGEHVGGEPERGPPADAAETLARFAERYFRADAARAAFLKRKLFYLKRRSRVASVAKYGKAPAPLLLALLPAPVAARFRFRHARAADAVPAPVAAAPEAASAAPAARQEEPPAATEAAEAAAPPDARDEERERAQLLEAARARAAAESARMAAEDELSRALGGDEESDEDEGGAVMDKPKRADFSRSYFFGNLPAHFRFLSASGWGGAGSGVDNGDEEIEEEERLERERARQRLLEQQEAERILEAERQAERQRIDKERDEKALQTRRMRAVELKKVLLHQAELEAQRRLELERRREQLERQRMASDEAARRSHLARLQADRRAMEAEDAATAAERRERRAAAARAMRRMLTETAAMTAEDERSRRAMRELRRRELEDEARRRYLAQVFSAFEPFFPTSALPSEDAVPSVQRRLRSHRQLQALQRPSHSPYTIPFAEAVALEDVEPEPYLARDSRKFQLLMGISMRRSRQHKRSRIPSEEAIIQAQQHKSLLPLHDAARESAAAHRKLRRKPECWPRQLPELLQSGRDDEMLADLSDSALSDRRTGERAASTNQNQRLHRQHEQQRPPSLTPFFRGDMHVRGLSQGRARDYAYS